MELTRAPYSKLVRSAGRALTLKNQSSERSVQTMFGARGFEERHVIWRGGGVFQYTVLPFGLHGTSATFQRLMDKLLHPHSTYASAYLKEIINRSLGWEKHLDKLEAVLDTFKRTGSIAYPQKCHVGLTEAKFLGYVAGSGQVKPQIQNVEAIKDWPRPINK